MAVSLTCKTFKEAQVRNQLLSLVVLFMPMFFIVNPGKEPAWLTLGAGDGANTDDEPSLERRSEAVAVSSFGIAIVVALAIMAASLTFVSRKMREVVAQ